MKKRKGVVLIAVIGFLVLITGAAIQMHAVCTRWLDDTIASTTLVRSRSLAEAGVATACLILDRDSTIVDWLGESWAQPHVYEIGGHTVSVRIEDLNARLNLAAIFTRQGQLNTVLKNLFGNLLALLGAPSHLMDCFLDWTDADRMPRLNGAEDEYYGALPVPYRCPNRTIRSTEELRLIKEFTPEILDGNDEEQKAGLLDLVTADSDSTINVNTCPGLILRAMGFGEVQVSQILAEREERPLSDSFLISVNREAYLAFRSVIRFKSSSFLVTSEAAAPGSVGVRCRAVVEKARTAGSQSSGQRAHIVRMEHL